MINTDKIVSVTKTDLITLYGTILKLSGVNSLQKIDAWSDDGQFDNTVSGNMIASEPVRKCNVTSGGSGVIYFVPAFNYEGFEIDETKVETEGAEVEPDGRTLYSATLSGDTITIAKAGF